MNVSDLYLEYAGTKPDSVQPLTPAGSSRRYFRLKNHGQPSLIGVEGVDLRENNAFIYLSRHLGNIGANVPEVLAVSADGMTYLVTDLGDDQLINHLDDRPLLEEAMRQLALVHHAAPIDMKWEICFPVSRMDKRAVLWDLNYFKYSFLNTEGIAYSEPLLEADFLRLADRCEAICDSHGTLMLRDFQSRNVMVNTAGTVYLIDYQGARLGPGAYDLASFLWQAKAGFPDETRRSLIDTYVDEFHRLGGRIERKDVHALVKEMALLRTLQVLGAYGLRGRFQQKKHFLDSIPAAIENLSSLLTPEITAAYPYLCEVAARVIEKETSRGSARQSVDKTFDGLTIRVTSFSFKKGMTADPSGNGGGFVYDCRAMDNPGRYEPYKRLTGLDAPVREFLESRGEIQLLLEDAERMVDRAVDNYLERGFTSLSVSFGCTGGQHRSVYCAQAMAEHLHDKYTSVRVLLDHREQSISETYLPERK